MSFTIAVAGKGGVGKTTVSGLLVRFLVETGRTPVLAVDADSNSNLNEVLGLEVDITLGQAREEMKSVSNASPSGMTKDMFIEMKVNQALVESTGFDLIAMGRPEGAGCYCAANHLLTASMEKLTDNYKYLVVDNEAGMEHISRVTTERVDLLLVVSDPSRRSMTAAKRVADLARDMKILTGPVYLIVNMARGADADTIKEVAESMGLTLAGIMPDDEELSKLDLLGKATTDLPPGNPAVAAAREVFGRLLSEAESQKVK